MERAKFDYAVEQIKCIPGGIKEACVIVREYLQNISAYDLELQTLKSRNSAVKVEEFLNAVKILMAYSWENRENDCIPELWNCDVDCSNVHKLIFCPGEYQIASKDEKGMSLSKQKCPHFRDSRYE